ncbi:hypothetical protein [Microbacterium thalli]|uniref:WXG100 family type VII secretion target n=1 Tax=Microbacterium thalli TaxID=3027921 RepID=A0ABT5SGV0_9MICO|nr:hypothetical protein [Microbacterium thalli]MDD7930583.1 hypothetical protein [Microbacterium thalli]MDD7962047.1 hypothetical protein [Microbacterium thalli]MDN8549745.1 hypothetical protein [Microbacterium thalli]
MSMMMPSSPRGREIDYLDGNPGDVLARGSELTSLAEAMATSADLLDRLATDGSDMEGDAIDKLRELSEEVYSELRRAANLYQAVGPHISAYGSQLESSQPRIRDLVDELEELWAAYTQAQQSADQVAGSTPSYPRGEDADDPVLRQQAEDAYESDRASAAAAAANARGDWDARAADFDAEYDTWYDAFSSAAAGIREDTSDAIEDTWDDNVRGFLETASAVLAVAGMVLAVLAIVVGGPIIALIGTIVAVAALVVTIAQMTYGDADGWDLAFAIIGVIPFGSILGKFSGAAGESMTFAQDAARWSGRGATNAGEYFAGLNAFHGMSFVEGAGNFASQLLSGKTIDEWSRVPGTAIGAVDTLVSTAHAQYTVVSDVVGWASGSHVSTIKDATDWHRLFS